MPKAYPKEFRDDVVRVAQQREEGVTVKQVAKDFGVSESCLTNWLTQGRPGRWRQGGAGSGGAGRVAGCQAPDPVVGAREGVDQIRVARRCTRGRGGASGRPRFPFSLRALGVGRLLDLRP
jgi:transposase-like protein